MLRRCFKAAPPLHRYTAAAPPLLLQSSPWHGVRQMRTPWADGPEFVTQCPIRPGETYTYRFTVEEQEGTLWWHAHSRWMRATVYGALVIYPKLGSSYPFPKPTREFPVMLGEWWNRDPMQVLRLAMATGAGANVSDAYTINGQPGDLYRCSSQDRLYECKTCRKPPIWKVVMPETKVVQNEFNDRLKKIIVQFWEQSL